MIINTGITIPTGTKIIPTLPVVSLYDFTSFTFTAAGVFGQTGSTRATYLASYNTVANPWLNNTAYYNVITQGIQEWTVPATGTYRIAALGASGGIHDGTFFPSFPGAGAAIQADVSLTIGEIIYIVVGQKPSSTNPGIGYNGSGGGGGTFLYTGASATAGIGGAGLIMVAGGGGGTGHGNGNGPPITGGNGKGGSSTTNSNEASLNETFGVNSRQGAGSAGNNGLSLGGNQTTTATGNNGSGGGTGWTGDGDDYSITATGGERFTGGVSSDGSVMFGGWGGGGGSDGAGNAGGGGGGYTGGGAGQGYQSVTAGLAWGGGGGGGSFIIAGATNTSMTAGLSGINYVDTTNGSVTITKL